MNLHGTGIDIVTHKRFRKKIKKNEFLSKYLSISELEQFNKSKTKQEKIEFASSRWACKEAIVKASDKEIIYSNISIANTKSGKPTVLVNNKLNKNIQISISHEKKYSICIAIMSK